MRNAWLKTTCESHDRLGKSVIWCPIYLKLCLSVWCSSCHSRRQNFYCGKKHSSSLRSSPCPWQQWQLTNIWTYRRLIFLNGYYFDSLRTEDIIEAEDAYLIYGPVFSLRDKKKYTSVAPSRGGIKWIDECRYTERAGLLDPSFVSHGQLFLAWRR